MSINYNTDSTRGYMLPLATTIPPPSDASVTNRSTFVKLVTINDIKLADAVRKTVIETVQTV
jgi:hypothetical protein